MDRVEAGMLSMLEDGPFTFTGGEDGGNILSLARNLGIQTTDMALALQGLEAEGLARSEVGFSGNPTWEITEKGVEVLRKLETTPEGRKLLGLDEW